jgi:hypothetical protein
MPADGSSERDAGTFPVFHWDRLRRRSQGGRDRLAHRRWHGGDHGGKESHVPDLGATLTVNDGTGSHKVISLIQGTTLGNANAQTNTMNGTADVKLGKLLDGGFTV